MIATRRTFLAGFLAAAAPTAGWAALGGARFLSAARLADGSHALIGLDQRGREAFRVPLPGRGHAAAAHPTKTIAVAFARRPGAFALVIDCADGRVISRLDSPEGRHFYGHGAFSADGGLLFTTENDYDAGEGRIGVWDVRGGYLRIGEFASAGVGPHDVALAPDGETLVVANGGIQTHPDAGRAKLNIPVMRPNVAWIRAADGALVDIAEPEGALHLNSLRHFAFAPDGEAVIGAQWQGDVTTSPALIARARPGRDLVWIDGPQRLWLRMQGYVGSVAVAHDGAEGRIAATGPRGGLAVVADFDAVRETLDLADVCGAAAGTGDALFLTTGGGEVCDRRGAPIARHDLAFDNHLIAVG